MRHGRRRGLRVRRLRRRIRELRWNTRGPIINQSSLARTLLCIVSTVIPVGVLGSFLAIGRRVAMFATSLAKRAVARCETALSANGMPVRSSMIQAWLDVRAWCKGAWGRRHDIVDNWWLMAVGMLGHLRLEKRVHLLLLLLMNWILGCLRLEGQNWWRIHAAFLALLILSSLLRAVVWHVLDWLGNWRGGRRNLDLLNDNVGLLRLLGKVLRVERLQRHQRVVVLEVMHDAMMSCCCICPAIFLKPHHH